MFGLEVQNQRCIIKNGHVIIDNLITSIQNKNKESHRDDLDQCIVQTFAEDSVNEVVEYTTNIDEDAVEVIFCDYNAQNNIIVDENDNNHSNIIHTNTVTRVNNTAPMTKYVNQVALGNIFTKGNEKMEELNIPMVREQR